MPAFARSASQFTPRNGLGLAVVAAVADLHDADIRFFDNTPTEFGTIPFSPVSYLTVSISLFAQRKIWGRFYPDPY